MIKENKLKTVITTLITLLPCLVGIIIWNRLPETVATHFGVNNEANGWSSRPFTVLAIPLFLAALHLLCLFITSADPKSKNIGDKSKKIIFWIIPLTSVVVFTAIYANALGAKLDVGIICILFIGVLYLVLGNFLPKAKQNYTFGVRLPWTLADEENWNRTHRVAGFCMVISGILIIMTSFLRNFIIFIILTALAAAIPIIYSFVYYRKHKNDKKDEESKEKES
jgi:uncharacterized membrane protein